MWVMFTVAATIMIFLPGPLGIEGMSGGFAISFISFFGVIVGLVVVLVYRGLASRFDAIVGGFEVIAHWTYPSEFWRRYVDEEYRESMTEVRPLFLLTSAMCLIAGVGTYLLDPEPGIIVLGVMIAVILLMGLAAYYTRRQVHRNNLRGPGEVIVARNGVLLQDNLHYWNYFGSKLEDVEYRSGEDYSVLIFTTWAPTMQFGQSYPLRVPIPPGEEAKALEIVSTLKPI